MDNRFELFTIHIAKISRCIRKIKTEEVQEFNLKSPHVSCLYYMYTSGEELTAKQLCDICSEDKASISRSIEYLEEKGFISCKSDAEKRYKSPLFLTESGIRVAKSISDKIDNVLNLASVGLSDEDRRNFYKSLILISDNLEKICNKY